MVVAIPRHQGRQPVLHVAGAVQYPSLSHPPLLSSTNPPHPSPSHPSSPHPPHPSSSYQVGFLWVWLIVGTVELILHRNPYCCPCLSNADFPVLVFPYSVPLSPKVQSVNSIQPIARSSLLTALLTDGLPQSLCLQAPCWPKFGPAPFCPSFHYVYLEIRGWIVLPLFLSMLYHLGVHRVQVRSIPNLLIIWDASSAGKVYS
jgi:hypothetical protein